MQLALHATISLLLAIALTSKLTVTGSKLPSKFCLRYREVFIELKCDGQKKGNNFLCSLLEVMFRQNDVGNPPCLFYPCTGWGQTYPRQCVLREACAADHIQALGMCSGGEMVCCRNDALVSRRMVSDGSEASAQGETAVQKANAEDLMVQNSADQKALLADFPV